VSRYDAVVFDVDGTLVWGSSVVSGAATAVAAARECGSVAFVSNNPTVTPARYADRLSAAGVAAAEREVVTAGSVTADLLATDYPGPAFVVGEPGLCDLLGTAGVTVTDRPAAAETVVASIDRSFDYDRLTAALRAFETGVSAFVGTDPDPTIPGEDGVVPGSGAVVDAVASVAERRPDAMAGKPAAPARRAAFSTVGTDPERTLVVGDRLDTDVALGARAGADTALVRSGVTDDLPDDADGPTPDHVLDSVAALPGLLAGD
jgi:4-nitrophenyl phosphatase